jgi:hypothetical protein
MSTTVLSIFEYVPISGCPDIFYPRLAMALFALLNIICISLHEWVHVVDEKTSGPIVKRSRPLLAKILSYCILIISICILLMVALTFSHVLYVLVKIILKKWA